MRYRISLSILATAAVMAWAPSALAYGPTAFEQEAKPVGVVAPRANPLGLKALNGSALSTNRGGSYVLNESRLKGVVADNVAVDVVTGGNFIADGALSGSSGMPTVIQNSGNNVLIQNSTTVNVQVK